jgi:hypothetical protein
MTNNREFTITWRDKVWVVSARVDGRKVSISCMYARDGNPNRVMQTFAAAPDEESEGGRDGQKATALTALSPEERHEVFMLVGAAARAQ